MAAMLDTFPFKDLVRISASFTDENGDPYDPEFLKFDIQHVETGNTQTATYGGDAALVRDSVGEYHIDFDCSASGRWSYRFTATGNGQTAASDTFRVDPEFV
jgi:hypothetical protein